MEDEKEFDLSEGQRISLLERTVSLNRKVVIVLVVLSVIGLSALSTLGIVSLLKEDIAYAKATELELVKKENEALRIQMAAFEKSLVQYRKIMDTSQALRLQTILRKQNLSETLIHSQTSLEDYMFLEEKF